MTDNPTQLENKPNLRELGRPVVIAWLDYHGINLPVAKAVDLMERIGAAINSRAPVVAPQKDAPEVIRQYLRDHALSPRAPLLVDDEAVCVCVICQFAREVMQPVFAKDRAELDRVLVEAIRDDPVGVRLTELQLERESREGSFSAPSPSSPVPAEQKVPERCHCNVFCEYEDSDTKPENCVNKPAAPPTPVEQEPK